LSIEFRQVIRKVRQKSKKDLFKQAIPFDFCTLLNYLSQNEKRREHIEEIESFVTVGFLLIGRTIRSLRKKLASSLNYSIKTKATFIMKEIKLL